MINLRDAAQRCHATAVAKGFHAEYRKEDPRHTACALALIFDECEEYKEGGNEAEELADIVLRTLDLMAKFQIEVPLSVTPCGGADIDTVSRTVAFALRDFRRGTFGVFEAHLTTLIATCYGVAAWQLAPKELDEAIEAKLQANTKRPALHGKLF